MASHNLAIAKATLAASLLRPDPGALGRDEVSHFHGLLDAMSVKCSSANVQKCKNWFFTNIVQSTGRCSALGKYLVALSLSFGAAQSTPSSREPSAKRKRLHFLYLLNDILHHAQTHVNDVSVAGKFQPVLMVLFSSAASFDNCPKHHRKLQSLLDIWDGKGYYSEDYISKLRTSMTSAAEGELNNVITQATPQGDVKTGNSKTKLPPYVMPAMHGDLSTPWYDLPAGNLMPHIVPNSSRPINPAIIRPLRFMAGPADYRLASAVKDFLRDANSIFGVVDTDETTDESSVDVDELGQPIIRDEISGEVLEGDGYYGWSRQFCEKMKRRRKGLDSNLHSNHRSRSSSRSRSSGTDELGRRRTRDDSRIDSRARSGSKSPSWAQGKRSRSRSFPRDRRGSYSNDSRSSSPRRMFNQNNAHYPSEAGAESSKDSDHNQAQSQISYAPHLPSGPPGPPPFVGHRAQPYGLHFPPPPPPESWPHPFPPPPPTAYNKYMAPPIPNLHGQYNIPPPPPFLPVQHNLQQQGPYDQTFPPPPPPGNPGGWQSQPDNTYAGRENQGDLNYGSQNHRNHHHGNTHGQFQGRGRGAQRSRGW